MNVFSHEKPTGCPGPLSTRGADCCWRSPSPSSSPRVFPPSLSLPSPSPSAISHSPPSTNLSMKLLIATEGRTSLADLQNLPFLAATIAEVASLIIHPVKDSSRDDGSGWFSLCDPRLLYCQCHKGMKKALVISDRIYQQSFKLCWHLLSCLRFNGHQGWRHSLFPI